jgi:hypothetical protein
MFHRVATANAPITFLADGSAQLVVQDPIPHEDTGLNDDARRMVDSLLAKLSLGETASQSRKGFRRSYYQIHPPKSLTDHFRKHWIQLTTSTEKVKSSHNKAWSIEVSALVEKLTSLPEADRRASERYITERLYQGSLLYRHRTRYGLDIFLAWYWAGRGLEYRCGRYSQTSVWLKQVSKAFIESIAVPPKYITREQLGWQAFIRWCCDNVCDGGFVGLLGPSYFVPEAEFGEKVKGLIEEKIGETQEAYTKTLQTMINCAGGIKAALAIASYCKYFDESQFCRQPVEKVIVSIETLDELAICEDAMHRLVTACQIRGPWVLNDWLVVSEIRVLIATRALQIVDKEIADGKLELKTPIDKKQFDQWIKSVQEWIQDPNKSVVTSYIGRLKAVPNAFKFLSTIWKYDHFWSARLIPGGYFDNFFCGSPLARVYYGAVEPVRTSEPKLIKTSNNK